MATITSVDRSRSGNHPSSWFSMRLVGMAAVLLAILPLSGCFWGTIFGADISVLVKNDTGDAIRVEAGGNLTGDSGWSGDSGLLTVASGGNTVVTIAGWEISPQVKVFYKGAYHIYHIRADWTGYDEIKVRVEDFPVNPG